MKDIGHHPDMTLGEVLAAYSWTHRLSSIHGKHDVFDETGKLVGSYSAGECWAMLRDAKMVPKIEEMSR